MKLVETPTEFANWCAERDYTREHVAEMLGVTRQTLYNWTHRKTDKPRSDKLPEDVKADVKKHEEAYQKLPRMLSLSLLALEKVGAEQHAGQPIRKRARGL